MSVSRTTKETYAAALRKLMQEMPFEKITVAHLCEKSGLSRKGFYYHFCDKYDLVAWIFDEDYIALVKNQSFTTWGFLDMLCGYLYENRDFYRKVLKVEGQNSFTAHFEDFISPLVENRLKLLFGEEEVPPVCFDFLSDGFVCSIKRWLCGKEPVSAGEFVSSMKSLIEKIAASYAK